ncbi:MAG: hypothetical protein KKC20_06425 [Proteobacteria bacterium]|nr:hypothetical protein [Pseudomonadota bacterium]
MSTIPDTSSTGLSGGRGNLQNAQFSGNLRKMSANAHESLDTGLTIKTREGDVVTLSSKSFSELNAFEYTSRGQIRSDSGSAQMNRHIREITLTTGERFSFSVQGDLNEQELADIEAIVKGVDTIAGEMVRGDMGKAMEKAMSMGSYDSVSMYSADISYQRSYAVSQETSSVSHGRLPSSARDTGILDGAKQVASLVDQMARFLEKQDEKLLAKAQHPLAALFDQLLKNQEDADETKTPAYEALKSAGEQLDQVINDMLKTAFKTSLNDFV